MSVERKITQRETDIPLGNVEDGLELELTLDGEVLDGGVVLPMIGERLVKGAVLILGDVCGVARPDGLGLVELLVLGGLLLDLLGLLGLVLVLIVDLLDLRVLLVLSLLLILNLLLRVTSAIKIKTRRVQNGQTFSTSFVTTSWMG